MLPPQFVGDTRQNRKTDALPDWLIRDMGERVYEIEPKRRWRLPIWPGFRLELRILPARGADHV